jgi:spore maturation protein SpmA
MLNGVFVVLCFAAAACAAASGRIPDLGQAALDSARSSVELGLGLLGQLALWLGLVQVVREAGVVDALSRGLRPVLRWLFPTVPAEHPALGAMVMMVGANLLALGNAATPFGLKAMQELDRLNPRPGVATDAMVRFVAIATSGVAVIPTEMIAIRAAAGATAPGSIILPSVLATAASTVVAFSLAALLQRWSPPGAASAPAPAPEAEAPPVDVPPAPSGSTVGWRLVAALGFGASVGVAFFVSAIRTDGPAAALRAFNDHGLLPALILGMVAAGWVRRVPVYDAFVRGAREAFAVMALVFPYLLAILLVLGMFRASGAMDLVTGAVGPWTAWLGFPADALPMALVRPLSGSGAMAVAAETVESLGPDSYAATLVTVLNGSTETTFYVLAIYFGSVRVTATRHALLACLAGDLTGVVAATVVTRAILF